MFAYAIQSHETLWIVQKHDAAASKPAESRQNRARCRLRLPDQQGRYVMSVMKMVPVERLELSRCCHRGILNPLRLPFRHTGRRSGLAPSRAVVQPIRTA